MMRGRDMILVGSWPMVLGASLALAGEVRFRPLVLSGQPVPGAPGVTFSVGPTNPSGGYTITGTGKFMVTAFTSAGTALIAGDARTSDPAVRVLVRNGEAAPGISGPRVFSFGGRYSQAPDGRGVWGVSLDASAPAGTGYVFYGESAIGAPFIIARQADPVPGLPGSVFGNLNALEKTPWVGGAGVFAFAAPIGTGTPADSAIWLGSLNTPGALTVLARQGQPVPGQPAGTTYGDLRSADPLVGPVGEVVNVTNLVVGGTTTPTLLYFPPSSQTPVEMARTGAAIAGVIPSGFIPSELVMNGDGQIAFVVTVSGVPQGRSLLVGNPSDSTSFRVAASAGSVAPGLSPLTLVASQRMCLGADGLVSFVSTLSGTGVGSSNDTALYAERGSGTSLVAREGVVNAALPMGQYLSTLSHPFGRDRLGQTMGLITLAGTGVTSTNDRATLVVSPAGIPVIAAREGGTLRLATGDVRTIRQLDDAVWSQPPKVSADGEFLLQLSFSNNTRAIMLGEMIDCPGDFDRDGERSLQDLFDFLAAWFAQKPRADVNGIDGVTVQDIFDFLAAWFAGCA